jgi:pyruvate kinase
MITNLLRGGVDVVRLNMSHGTHEAHREVYGRVRAAAKKLDRHMSPSSPTCAAPRSAAASFPRDR